jgi:hypothetical protein
MLRRILILVAAAVVSLALCLFLAVVLEWPKIVVYVIGLAPLFAAAASFGSAGQDRDGRRR